MYTMKLQNVMIDCIYKPILPVTMRCLDVKSMTSNRLCPIVCLQNCLSVHNPTFLIDKCAKKETIEAHNVRIGYCQI